MAHGYAEGAAEHYQEWLDAVQKISSRVKLDIVICAPWMNFRKLRVLTNKLRNAQPVYEIRGFAGAHAWVDTPLERPGPSCIEMSIRNMVLPPLNNREELVALGCRGFAP